MDINSEMLGTCGTRPSEDGRSDQGIGGTVSFSIFICATDFLSVHPPRGAGQVDKTSLPPSGESHPVAAGPPAVFNTRGTPPETNVDGGETSLLPRLVDTPELGSVSLPVPPPKDIVGDHSVHQLIHSTMFSSFSFAADLKLTGWQLTIRL